MSKCILQIKKTSKNAKTPTRASAKAAGYDLYAAEGKSVPAKSRELFKTDLQMAIPPGYYGRIAPRSGLALKHGIDVGAGVIDEDYRGDVGVLLFNFSDIDVCIDNGDRIAQLIVEKIAHPKIVEVDSLDAETERGDQGFGSTGK